MQAIYSWLPRSLASKQVILAVAVLAVPLSVQTERLATRKVVPQQASLGEAAIQHRPMADPRIIRLKQFFSRLHCPVLYLAEDFVRAADDNDLDWRLLPSISVVESGGGKQFRNNNIFGWNQGAEAFPTLRSGIHEVAFKLGHSPLYRNRDVVGKLRIYNPDENYAQLVLTVMNRVSPVENLGPRPAPQSREYSYN